MWTRNSCDAVNVGENADDADENGSDDDDDEDDDNEADEDGDDENDDNNSFLVTVAILVPINYWPTFDLTNVYFGRTNLYADDDNWYNKYFVFFVS